jgi:DnaJ-class molecular chaperone
MDCVVCGGKGRPASTCLTCKGEGLVTQKLKITLPLDGSDAYLIKEAGDDTVTQRSSGIRFRVSEEPHPHFATCEKDLLGYIRAPLSRYYTHGTVAFQHPDGTTKRLSLLRSDGAVIPSGALADYAGLGLPVGPESKDRGHLRVIVEAELPRDKQAAQAEAARVLAGVATETGASEAVTAEHITDPLRFQWHKLNPIPLLS